MAKSTTNQNRFVMLLLKILPSNIKDMKNGTVTLYKMVKKDLINIVAEIYDLIYNKRDQDENSRNKTKNDLQNRLQKSMIT